MAPTQPKDQKLAAAKRIRALKAGIKKLQDAQPTRSTAKEIQTLEDKAKTEMADAGITEEDMMQLDDETNEPENNDSSGVGNSPNVQVGEQKKSENLNVVAMTQNREYTPEPNDDPCDIVTLTQAVAMLQLANKSVTSDGDVRGWIAGKFGDKGAFAILEKGPIGQSVFRCVPVQELDPLLVEEPDKDLGQFRPGEEKIGRHYVIKPDEVDVFIQGVVWDYPINHPCPILLLNPNNWPYDKKQQRRITPFTRIKVKYVFKKDKDTKIGWETRSTVRRFFRRNKPTTIPQNFDFEGHTVMHAGEIIGVADFSIIIAAATSEMRYKAGPSSFVKEEEQL